MVVYTRDRRGLVYPPFCLLNTSFVYSLKLGYAPHCLSKLGQPPWLFTHVTAGGRYIRHIFLYTTSFVYVSEVKFTLGAVMSAKIRSFAMFLYITWPPEGRSSAIIVTYDVMRSLTPPPCLFFTRGFDVTPGGKRLPYLLPSIPTTGLSTWSRIENTNFINGDFFVLTINGVNRRHSMKTYYIPT